MLPVLDTAAMSALPGYLLLETSQVAAAFNTSGPLSRRGPLGLVATSLSAAASVAGLMVREWDLCFQKIRSLSHYVGVRVQSIFWLLRKAQ